MVFWKSGKMTITIFTVSDYILANFPKISLFKLQMITYYIKVWCVVAEKDILEDVVFTKGKSGVRNEILVTEFKEFKNPEFIFKLPIPELDGMVKELIDFIIDNYIDYPDHQLSFLISHDPPYVNVEYGEGLSNNSILEYYKTLSFARNFKPFDLDNNPYYVVRDNSFYSYTLDMSAPEVERAGMYPSYREYKRDMEIGKEKVKLLIAKIFMETED